METFGSGTTALRLNTANVTVPRSGILEGVVFLPTWSLTLREERSLRVSEDRVRRRIFGPRREEVIGEYRKLHNEEMNNLYSSPNILRVIISRRMR